MIHTSVIQFLIDLSLVKSIGIYKCIDLEIWPINRPVFSRFYGKLEWWMRQNQPSEDGSKRLTVNIDIFALYIFLRNSRFLNIRENMYTSKITFILA